MKAGSQNTLNDIRLCKCMVNYMEAEQLFIWIVLVVKTLLGSFKIPIPGHVNYYT